MSTAKKVSYLSALAAAILAISGADHAQLAHAANGDPGVAQATQRANANAQNGLATAQIDESSMAGAGVGAGVGVGAGTGTGTGTGAGAGAGAGGAQVDGAVKAAIGQQGKERGRLAVSPAQANSNEVSSSGTSHTAPAARMTQESKAADAHSAAFKPVGQDQNGQKAVATQPGATGALSVTDNHTSAVQAPTMTGSTDRTSSVTVPAVTAPAVTVPAVTIPAVTVPAVTIPTVTVPVVTAPTVTVPSVQRPSM